MTIEHAEKYLDELRRTRPGWKDKRQAKKLAKTAAKASNWRALGPAALYEIEDEDEYSTALREWDRLLVRIYDESIRLRAIAEGKR